MQRADADADADVVWAGLLGGVEGSVWFLSSDWLWIRQLGDQQVIGDGLCSGIIVNLQTH